MRSAASSVSPSASMRFLPTSMAISAEISISRSEISSAARRRIVRRPSQPSAAQAGCAARAAAMASCTSWRVPSAKRPTSRSRSMGERSSDSVAPARSWPAMTFRWLPPRPGRTRASAASNWLWSCSLSARSVA